MALTAPTDTPQAAVAACAAVVGSLAAALPADRNDSGFGLVAPAVTGTAAAATRLSPAIVSATRRMVI